MEVRWGLTTRVQHKRICDQGVGVGGGDGTVLWVDYGGDIWCLSKLIGLYQKKWSLLYVIQKHKCQKLKNKKEQEPPHCGRTEPLKAKFRQCLVNSLGKGLVFFLLTFPSLVKSDQPGWCFPHVSRFCTRRGSAYPDLMPCWGQTISVPSVAGDGPEMGSAEALSFFSDHWGGFSNLYYGGFDFFLHQL